MALIGYARVSTLTGSKPGFNRCRPERRAGSRCREPGDWDAMREAPPQGSGLFPGLAGFLAAAVALCLRLGVPLGLLAQQHIKLV